MTVEGLTIHVAEGGDPNGPAILFLHGWPESWFTFSRVMESLMPDFRVIAIDLPGIGQSSTPSPSNDKRTLARLVHGVARILRIAELTLVGHDVGGQVTFAYLREYPRELRRAVIMNVAIPGIDPWSEVRRNPQVWHYGFHAVPTLPEALVQGHQSRYFAYFFETIAATRDGVPPRARQVYAEAYFRAEALRTGFEWYRSFPQDEQDNGRLPADPIPTPVLYLRGSAEQGMDLKRYVEGLRSSGLTTVDGHVIPNSGHFAPDEQPEAVAIRLRDFVRTTN